VIVHESRFYVECDVCEGLSGDVGTQTPARLPTLDKAVADAVNRGWSHDPAIGRLLCPECAPSQDTPTIPPALSSATSDAAQTGLAPTSARALLTDAEGHVIKTMVLAPADVESWEPNTPVVVSWPGWAAQVRTIAGRLALYEPEIGRESTEPLAPDEFLQPNCAYCDHYLMVGAVDYAVYDGKDRDGGVCPAHPRTDRPRPHLPKWRVWNDTAAMIFIADPANPERTRELRARQRRIAALFPLIGGLTN
jgi:hypothetical protein